MYGLMSISGLIRIRYHIFCIYMISHVLTISHILTDFQSSDLPIFQYSVWRDPIRIQCRIYFLICPSMALYDLYGLQYLELIYSCRCNFNTYSLDTLPMASPYSYLSNTDDRHYSNLFLISPNNWQVIYIYINLCLIFNWLNQQYLIHGL